MNQVQSHEPATDESDEQKLFNKLLPLLYDPYFTVFEPYKKYALDKAYIIVTDPGRPMPPGSIKTLQKFKLTLKGRWFLFTHDQTTYQVVSKAMFATIQICDGKQ